MNMRPEHSFVTGSTLRLRGYDGSNYADEKVRRDRRLSLLPHDVRDERLEAVPPAMRPRVVERELEQPAQQTVEVGGERHADRPHFDRLREVPPRQLGTVSVKL